jgi:hypothetical protein
VSVYFSVLFIPVFVHLLVFKAASVPSRMCVCVCVCVCLFHVERMSSSSIETASYTASFLLMSLYGGFVE